MIRSYWTVYSISLRGDDEIRYIGETRQPLICRLAGHINGTRCDGMLPWLEDNIDDLEIASLGQFNVRRDALEFERNAIKDSLEKGHRLFNSNHVPGRRSRTSYPRRSTWA